MDNEYARKYMLGCNNGDLAEDLDASSSWSDLLSDVMQIQEMNDREEIG